MSAEPTRLMRIRKIVASGQNVPATDAEWLLSYLDRMLALLDDESRARDRMERRLATYEEVGE